MIDKEDYLNAREAGKEILEQLKEKTKKEEFDIATNKGKEILEKLVEILKEEQLNYNKAKNNGEVIISFSSKFELKLSELLEDNIKYDNIPELISYIKKLIVQKNNKSITNNR